MKRAVRGPNEHPPKLTPKTGRPSKALKGLPVHQCAYDNCGKVYTRKEHLLRHERTHRNELPYVCPECRQGYARQDLLKRHASLKHGQGLNATAESNRTVPAHVRSFSLTTSPVSALPPDPRTFPGNDQNEQQTILPQAMVPAPTRQLSTTSQAMDRLSQLRISPRSSQTKSTEGHHGIDTTPKKLPEPWGAQSFASTPEQIDVDLLRAASYGDLTEIRRMHLRGTNVLATGTFGNGEPKSALFSAAEAIKTCFEDIQKLHTPLGPDRERLWKEISSKAEVVQYLMYHGARLDNLEPTLREHVYRALQGQPEAGLAVPYSQQPQGGFRPIAAASADVRLPPIVSGPPSEKLRRISLSTNVISRVKADTIEANDSRVSPQGKELAR